jgi:uncharacterized protein YecE (DUF72 family)
VQIDEPKFRFSIRQDLLPNVNELPLHAAARQERRAVVGVTTHSEDRYNYLYTEAELTPIADAARMARALVKKQYVYLNNHFAAQAVADAVVLRRCSASR